MKRLLTAIFLLSATLGISQGGNHILITLPGGGGGGGGGVTNVIGTANRITSTGGTAPIINISPAYVGQTSLTTLGTITTGTWNATPITDPYISSSTNWNTAFGWGNHAAAGYLTAEGDPVYSASSWFSTTNNSTDWNTAYTNRITALTTTGSSGASTLISNTLNVPNYTLSGLGGQPSDADLTAIAALSGTSGFLKTNGAGTWTVDVGTYLTAEADPVYSASSWFSTTNNSANWNTAFGWGDHSTEGYFVGTNSTIRALLSETVTGLDYDNSTGVFSTTSGYVIPTTTDETNWNAAFGWGDHSAAGYLTTVDASTTYLSYTVAAANYQPLSPVLTDLSVLTYGSNNSKFIRLNSAGTGFEFATVTPLSDADYGDITVSGTGTVMTIDNLAVNDAKINDVAWSKITSIDAQVSDLAGLSYASNALKVVRVNAAETGWELATISGGGLSDGDYGDITVSGTGTIMTIDNLAVTNAKINDVAWSKVTSTPTTLAGYAISDTKANFDVALSDGNFAYQSDLVGYQPLDLQLTDVSGLSYPGNGLKVIRVNAAETGFELVTPSGGALSDGDYGDITVGGSGTTMTIDNLAVTNAKINDVAWSKVTGTPTTLAGYSISDAQGLDAQLTDLAGLSYGSNALKVVRVNAAATGFELATVSGGGLSDGDYGDVIVSGTGTAMAIENNFKTESKGITVDGQGSVITASNTSYGYTIVPFAGTITGWSIDSDISGSAVFDVKVGGTSLVGAGNKPTLSSQSTNTASVSGWTTTSTAANDKIEFVANSASTLTRVTVTLYITRN